MGNIGKLYACLNKLGGLSLDTLKERKILQKQIYFLQQFGLDLGYHFGWYVYGPYSSDLTHDAYSLLQQKEQAPNTVESPELSSKGISAIEKLEEFLKGFDENAEKFAYWAELLSSIHFLWKISYYEKKPINVIVEKLKAQKGERFSDEDIAQAWKHLSKFNLVSS